MISLSFATSKQYLELYARAIFAAKQAELYEGRVIKAILGSILQVLRNVFKPLHVQFARASIMKKRAVREMVVACFYSHLLIYSSW